MSDLARTRQVLGDITFGMPKDVELINRPWGFYEFFGIPRNATREDIQKAFRRLSLKFHPDRPGGDAEQFKALDRIYNILFDDGGDLGADYSQRKQYDRVSELDELFDGQIELNGVRTKRLSEIILANMQAERQFAEHEQELRQKNSRYNQARKDLDELTPEIPGKTLQEKIQNIAKKQDELNSEQKRRVEQALEDFMESLKTAQGITPERQREIEQIQEERQKRKQREGEQFIQDFRWNPGKYFSKVLDVIYVGGDSDSTVIFGGDRLNLNLAGHEVSDKLLRLMMGGTNCLRGWNRVHFKAQEGNVRITDVSLTGIIHVVQGSVAVDYGASSYGGVIRVKTGSKAQVASTQGFVDAGSDGSGARLYYPIKMGSKPNAKPVLEIAVHEGTVSLSIRNPQVFAPSLDDLFARDAYSSLSDLLSDKIIKEKFYTRNNEYIIKKNLW